MLRNGTFRRNVFDAAAERAGLAGLAPHGLRHTAASLAIQAGATVVVVQRMLGHASSSITLDVYSHLFTDDLDTVADRLSTAKINAAADQVRTNRPVTVLWTITGKAGNAEGVATPALLSTTLSTKRLPPAPGSWPTCTS